MPVAISIVSDDWLTGSSYRLSHTGTCPLAGHKPVWDIDIHLYTNESTHTRTSLSWATASPDHRPSSTPCAGRSQPPSQSSLFLVILLSSTSPKVSLSTVSAVPFMSYVQRIFFAHRHESDLLQRLVATPSGGNEPFTLPSLRRQPLGRGSVSPPQPNPPQ